MDSQEISRWHVALKDGQFFIRGLLAVLFMLSIIGVLVALVTVLHGIA